MYVRHRLYFFDEHRFRGGQKSKWSSHHDRLRSQDDVRYALEGSVFTAGQVISWLKDELDFER